MKRSMKKYLILALVVMAIVLTTVCTASAAPTLSYHCTKCNETVSPIYINIKDATCEAPGTAELACPGCYKSFNTTIDIEGAKGHDFENDNLEYKASENNTYYELTKKCSNCDIYEVEHDAFNNVVKYHKVTFVNEWATKTYIDYKYAKIATDYKEVETVKFLKEGELLSNAGVIAVREADAIIGRYDFKAWTTEDGTKLTSVPADAYDYEVFAFFEADDTIQYTIQFYREDGYLLEQYTKIVNHGRPINGSMPVVDKADDVIYSYLFAKWVWMGDGNTVIGKETPIYGAPGLDRVIKLKATYTKEPRVYRLNYFDRDGNPIVMPGGEVAWDNVTLGTYDNNTKLEPKNGRLALTYKPEIRTYKDIVNEYFFTGKWIVKGTDRVIDLNNLNLMGLVDIIGNPVGYDLVPQYEPVERIYPIKISAKIENTGANRPKALTITIKDAEGFFVDSKKFTGPSTADGAYEYTAKLPYAEKYEVVITAEGYSHKTFTYFQYNEEEFTQLDGVTLVHNEREDCDCFFCHSFLQPIVVKIYNVINSLFKKKIVCCDDMYATIGDRLNYAY